MKCHRYLKRLLPFYAERKWMVLAVILLGVGAALCEGLGVGLIIPLFQALMGGESSGFSGGTFASLVSATVDRTAPDHRLAFVMGAYFLIIVLKNAMVWSNQVSIAWLTHRTRFDVIRKIQDQLLKVGYRYIQAQRQGAIYNLITQESARTAVALGEILQITTALFIMSVYIVILCAIAWKISLLAFMLSCVFGLSMSLISARLKRIGQETSARGKQLMSVWIESLQAMRTIRIFGTEQHERGRHRKAERDFYMNMIRKECNQGLVSPLSEVFTTLVVVVVLSLFVSSYGASITQALPFLVTFLFVMGRIQNCLGKLNVSRMNISSSASGVEQVLGILDESDKPYVRDGTLPIGGLKGELRFEDVRYRYPTGDEDVIGGVSFSIPKGKVTAIVGCSGSGKSTLLDLILRLDDPVGGRIVIDGVDLREYRLGDWRRLIGTVDQDVFLFNASVRDNIRYGLLEATDGEIVRAAELANAHEFISELPEGYDTVLGDRGTRLSGGQKQRIAIARAVLRDAQIMVFDEATSSLDSKSELLIHNAIERLSADRTIIIVAHRLSSVARAENIIFLKDGAIAEMGTHQDLTSRNGEYSQMYQIQTNSVHKTGTECVPHES